MNTALNAVVTLVTHLVLFSRKSNENSTTPMYPVGAYTPGMVDLEARGTFCLSSDDDRPVEGKLYEVREVVLPSFLSPNEWASNMVAWKYTWGCGVNPTWPEAWQRGLAKMDRCANRVACVGLLKVKNFRSAFRKSMHDQLVTWLETSTEDRKFGSPFSMRQWDCILDVHVGHRARSIEAGLSRSRTYTGVDVAA